MKFITPVYLIIQSTTTNDIGDLDYTNIERKVFANIGSIKQSEFYQAQSTGFKPEITFEIRSFEYKSEQLIKYNEKIYNVIRTFDKKDGIIELICSKDINNGNS